MTVLDWWLLAATIAATICTLTFVVRYAATLRWERTSTGRSIMALSAALTLAEAAAVARRIDELDPGIDLTTTTTTLAAIAWTAITAVFIWRHWALTHPRRVPPPEVVDDDEPR